jgi:hypothetical protein
MAAATRLRADQVPCLVRVHFQTSGHIRAKSVYLLIADIDPPTSSGQSGHRPPCPMIIAGASTRQQRSIISDSPRPYGVAAARFPAGGSPARPLRISHQRTRLPALQPPFALIERARRGMDAYHMPATPPHRRRHRMVFGLRLSLPASPADRVHPSR